MSYMSRVTRPAATHAIPLDEFLAKKAEIGRLLGRLQALSDEHFRRAPDEITWGDVGDLGFYAARLHEIADAAFQEGEHACL